MIAKNFLLKAFIVISAISLLLWTMKISLDNSEVYDILHEIRITGNPTVNYMYVGNQVEISFLYPNNSGSFEYKRPEIIFNGVRKCLLKNGWKDIKLTQKSGYLKYNNLPN